MFFTTPPHSGNSILCLLEHATAETQTFAWDTKEKTWPWPLFQISVKLTQAFLNPFVVSDSFPKFSVCCHSKILSLDPLILPRESNCLRQKKQLDSWLFKLAACAHKLAISRTMCDNSVFEECTLIESMVTFSFIVSHEVAVMKDKCTTLKQSCPSIKCILCNSSKKKF